MFAYYDEACDESNNFSFFVPIYHRCRSCLKIKTQKLPSYIFIVYIEQLGNCFTKIMITLDPFTSLAKRVKYLQYQLRRNWRFNRKPVSGHFDITLSMTIIVYETLARRMILRHRNATGSWFNLRCTVTFHRLFTWALSACCPFTTISRVLPTRSVNLVTVSRGLPIRSCSLWARYQFFTFERVSRRFNLKLIRSQHAVNSVRVQIEWHSISKWRACGMSVLSSVNYLTRV